ncbi:MAG: hypothetical protein KatS3mg114_0654 [Planctomycetaceae bacterium]|nr:MAG: hypothetical protein KatS3mg114_0654 [Planctomycetaceae bacterium]
MAPDPELEERHPVGQASLLVVTGPEQGTRFELRSDAPVCLGRAPENPLRLYDQEVSRLHAEIQPSPEGFWLIDRRSSNGTYVNGQRIERHLLHDGDQIVVGRTLLRFEHRDYRERDVAARPQVEIDGADQSSIVHHLAVDDDLSLFPPRGSDLQTLYHISEEVVRPATTLEELMRRILTHTLRAVRADRGCVMLGTAVHDLQTLAVVSRPQLPTTTTMPVSRSIVDYVLRHRQSVQTTDAQHDARFDRAQSIARAGIREAMCVPLQGRNNLLGVMYLDVTTPADQFYAGPQARFQPDQLQLLAAIGRQTALAIENFQYQQAIVRAERLAAIGQTIATLSHHIKNILQGVRGGSYLIDLGLKENNQELVRRGWSIVERNQDKIYHLVMDMLTFSKERRPAWKRVQLNDLVREIVELVHVRAKEGGVELHVRLDPHLPVSTFDPEGIHRAVLNVVINALDAVEDSPQAAIVIETGYDAAQEALWVSVTDNGPGIPPEQLSRLFQLFESTKGARGTGLGLAVTQKILREHGGDISVSSQPGQGARFVLRWPRHDAERPSDHEAVQETLDADPE